MNDKELKQAKELISELFEKLDLDAEFDLNYDEETLNLALTTEDSGIVIGHHGEVLEALQLIISMMLGKKLDKFVRVNIEVGDYKKNREEYLKSLADKVKQRVLDENREQTVSSLKPWERRVMHMYLQDDPDVVSESVGEGRERVLIIRPK